MIDHNSQFMAILTAVGEAKQANADALGIPWTFAQMGVGDANGTDPLPERSQTRLINEQRRAPLNQVRIDPSNSNLIIAEQVIPENAGGWWIREIDLYDADGDLVAVANCAPSFKPLLAQGSGKTQVVRINFIVTSAANVTLKIDPSVVLATRQYVDGQIIEVLPPTRPAGTYQKVTINERGVVIAGSNPQTLASNGITDAYTRTETDAAVKAAIEGLISGAPGALDTLKELSDALGGDPDFANSIINALAEKATKATTLAGYGITDGLPIRNPLGGGSLDLHGGQYAFVTSQVESTIGQNCYWNGTHWLRRDTSAAAVCVSLVNGRVGMRKVAAGSNPIAWSSSPELIDTSMSATQAEAESGADVVRWMNPLAVARYVAKQVVQASEAIMGIAHVATLGQVTTGTDDATVVTPKKLKWGFSFSPTANGYLCFPSWMGGFLLQWGHVYESQGATDYRSFNVPFPNACFGMVISLEAATVGGHGANLGLVTQVTDRTKFLWSVGGNLFGQGYGFYLAWGH